MIHHNKSNSPLRAALLALSLLTLVACGEQRFQAPLAQNFTLPRLDGEGSVSLSEFQGDVVYIAFWASWCVPCRAEMPHLQTLWEQHREDGFQVLAVNVDEDLDAARSFVAEHGLKFPIVLDTDKSVSKTYRVAGYPTHYIVGRDGRVHFSALGFTEDDALAVTVEVQTLLRGTADGAG